MLTDEAEWSKKDGAELAAWFAEDGFVLPNGAASDHPRRTRYVSWPTTSGSSENS